MGSIISQIRELFKLAKLKAFLLEFFFIILILLALICAFLLGKASKFLEMHPVFTFETKEQEDMSFEQEKDALFGIISTSTIVASVTGKKYYFVWCKGASNIKESKRKYFETESIAQKAGYTLAANCH
jgi:hypothetical protein